jgi:RNA polymerase sigma factor (sigma-70 family)
MQNKSDAQLLREYAEQRSEPAFAEIVARHTDLVYSAAFRQTGSPELAREIAQSVFTDLARKARTLARSSRPDDSLAGWLYRSTRFATLTRLRGERRRQAHERQFMEHFNPASETAPDWERIAPVIEEAMAGLDDAEREAVLLRYFKNQDFQAVGLALGVSDVAAQKRVSRAVERLRKFFAQRGVNVGASGLALLISANAVQAAPIGLAGSLSVAALVGGTTLTTTTTQAIAMTTAQKVLITAVLAAAVGTGLYEAREATHARNSASTLQEHQAALGRQIQQLTREREEAMRLLAGIPDDDRLNGAAAELLRLRGEVTRLRGESEEMLTRQAAAAKTNAATAQRQGVDTNWVNAILVVGRDQLVDAGNGSPEAAWESRYWARAQGDYDAVIAATDPQKVDIAKAWMGDKATFRDRSQTEFAQFKGLQILARKNVANDRVELKYQFAFGENPTRQETKIVEMVKMEGGWKSGQTRAYDPSWDDGRQPETRP